MRAGQVAGEPGFPDGVRPFRAGDEAAILEAALAAVARGELEGVNRHWIEESTARLAEEPELAAVAVEDDRVVGWVVPVHDDLTVDLPYRRRGHGTRLVEAGRILAARAGHHDLRLWVPRRPGPEAFAAAAGLRYRSSLWQLRLPTDAAVADPRFGDDVAVRSIEPGLDEPALVDLVNTTFLDHPSPLSLELGRLRRLNARPEFDPSTILLVAPAADRERLVAFCRFAVYPDDDGRLVGEVKLVGVLPEFRGRGLGRELVRWGVTQVRARGARDVVLAVEGQNAGALRLYQALGFHEHVEWRHWAMAAAMPGLPPDAVARAGDGDGDGRAGPGG
jgi:mycothiol synthase